MQGYKAINITYASRVRLNYTLAPYTSIRAIRAVHTQYLCRNISLQIISLRDIDKPGYGAKNITEYYSEHCRILITISSNRIIGLQLGFVLHCS
jgi:hypothetical protein